VNSRSRRLLRLKRDEQIEKLTRDIVEGTEGVDLKSELARIDAYSNLLSVAEASPGREWMWPAFLASVCVAVVGILWSVQISRTDVSVALDTDSLRADLATPWKLENVKNGYVFRTTRLMHFDRLDTISAPNLGISIERSSGDAWIELEGGQIALQSLEFKENTFVEIQSDDDEVNLYASRGAITGIATVLGKVTVSAGPRVGEESTHKSFNIDIPETIEFAVVGPRGVPTQISVHKPNKWALSTPRSRDVSFVREENSGVAQRALTSGIKTGTIRFGDTTWPVLDLREGDLVRVNKTESARMDARGDTGAMLGAMHVTLTGLVGSVTVGDSETKRDLAPSYLEYLYNRKSLTFFWSAIVFLWGVIWRVSKTLFE